MPDPKQALIEQVKKLRDATKKAGEKPKGESASQSEEQKQAS